MKILWLVNIVMPELAVHLGRTPSVFGGWLTGAMHALKSNTHELVICAMDNDVQGMFEVDHVTYYLCKSESFSGMEACFKEILAAETPDVVHIYGTEYEHTLAMANVSESTKTLVTIQGAMMYLKDALCAGIPESVWRDNILHKILRYCHKGGESIELQKQDFERKSVYEIKTLQKVGYVNGGSDWGTSVAKSVDPMKKVMNCNLILRDSFYTDDRWKYESCEKHSIYILHSYPIKGFHMFLEALRILRIKYPDVKVYVVANRLPCRHYGKFKTWIMNHAQDYNWYVQNIIEKNDLQGCIEFLGHLNESQVKERMLRCHVFVSASSMENQSTSLGEAMILGVPSVASCVGAIQEMIVEGRDGFIYPFNEPHLLAHQIDKIFENRDLAEQFSALGHEHAAQTYNREKNCQDLLRMYETIYHETHECT